MKTIKELRNRKGVSPVIATVILVAVTITVAVAVAYWMSGIAGQYTQFEKIEIQSGYATKNTGDTGWDILITLKNSGTSTATIINCFLNEQIIGDPYASVLLGDVTATGTTLDPYATPGDAGTIGVGGTGITINSGESVKVTITEVPIEFSSSGTTVNVKLHSAQGMDYIRLITLP